MSSESSSLPSTLSLSRQNLLAVSATASSATGTEKLESTARQLQTPHSGYHFSGTPNDRFFEGWYFRVTIPEIHQSFAFIYSVEDPGKGGVNSGTGVQVMGPEDGYVVQFSTRTDIFWGSESELALGASFQPRSDAMKAKLKRDDRPLLSPRQMVDESTFNALTRYGFQSNSTWNQGHIRAVGVVPPGEINNTVSECKWAFSTRPTQGYGSEEEKQRSTAGWLSALPIFEPHWQILMADGRSDGWIEWGGKRYEFSNAPTYAEKNWGKGFPSKWFWIQCNSFYSAFKEEGEGQGKEEQELSVTAVGALRELPGIGGEETVGLIAIHHNGRFLEFFPQDSKIEWETEEWGSWKITAFTPDKKLKAEIIAKCDSPGTLLRAPTDGKGLAPACRDTFEGVVEMKIWELDELIVNAKSTDGGLEIGGGPWETTWKDSAEFNDAIKTLLSVDVDLDGVFEQLPPLKLFKPRGL